MVARLAPRLQVASLLVLFAFTLALAACGNADATPPAGCLRAAGEAGETVWCPVCARGWVSGVETADKREVDAALTATVEAEAKQRGLSGTAIDRILGDVATGFARRKTCGCTACASGKPHAEHAADVSHASEAVPTGDVSPANDNATSSDATSYDATSNDTTSNDTTSNDTTNNAAPRDAANTAPPPAQPSE